MRRTEERSERAVLGLRRQQGKSNTYDRRRWYQFDVVSTETQILAGQYSEHESHNVPSNQVGPLLVQDFE